MKPNFTSVTDAPEMRLMILEVVVPTKDSRDFEECLERAIDELGCYGHVEITEDTLIVESKKRASEILVSRRKEQ